MHGRRHDVEKLDNIFREIRKTNFLGHAHFARPTYIKLIKAFANANDGERVDKYIEMMKKRTTLRGKQHNNTWKTDLNTYTTFVSAYGKVKNFEAVSRILKEMQQNEMPLDGSFHNALLSLYTSSQDRRL